jgi:putative ABC transport system permease protein
MFKNLIKVAFRNILKEKIYSFINVLGLTIGISCSLFLVLYILDEVNYDSFHQNKEQIYRVVTHFQEPDNSFSWPNAQIPLAQELEEQYTEVARAVRFINTGRELFVNAEKDRRFYEEDLFFADSSVFEVFTFPFIAGDPATALLEPNSLVLTRSLAQKYFDNDDPIGQSLQNGEETYKITGVIEDVPHNSHLDFDGLISRASLDAELGHWGSWGVATYLLLGEDVDYRQFEESFDTQINQTHIKPMFDQYGVIVRYELQPLESIHLYSNLEGETEGGGDISYVYIFGAVAFFMLLIASINYMNLATARAARRAKEVGIRKTAGSTRWQLIRQFLTESTVLAIISLLLSLLLIALLLPGFNFLSGKEIAYGFIFQPQVVLSLVGIVILIGLAGGSYPAFYLSRFEPAHVLKGQKGSSSSNASLRKVLVVTQFAISITMLISTWVVYDQLQFIRSKDLGFDKSQLVTVVMAEQETRDKYDVIRNRLLSQPQVIGVATSNAKPGQGISKNLINVETEDQGDEEKGVNLFFADYDFAEVLGFQILEGRNFDRKFATDTAAALVNEAMVARMNWENPIGKTFSSAEGTDFKYTVVGVVKDYHQNSLYSPIEPLAIFCRKNNYQLQVKIKGDDVAGGVAALESVWSEVNPGKPMEYTFLDEDFDEQYVADVKRGQVFTIFSGLTVIIACLGLLGLAAYTTQQRDKEIGIRKVIGATVPGIMMLIYKDFFILIGIAVLLAFPAAYYFMNSWLDSFAYQTEIKVVTFLASAILTVIITIVAVGFHTIRAATANPVSSLRDG